MNKSKQLKLSKLKVDVLFCCLNNRSLKIYTTLKILKIYNLKVCSQVKKKLPSKNVKKQKHGHKYCHPPLTLSSLFKP